MSTALAVHESVFPSRADGSLTHVVTLFVLALRNRRTLLTYHATHDCIGISTLDKIHGEVAVAAGDARCRICT